MTRFFLTALSALAAAALPSPAHAQVDPAVSLNFYLTEAAYSGCGLFDDTATRQCDDLAFSPRPGPAQLWVIASRTDGFPDGIASVGFGVIHNALEVQAWATCTGGPFFQGFGWPDSGGTLVANWPAPCYQPVGENAKVGYFALGRGDQGLAMITNEPVAQWLDCSIDVDWRICALNLPAVILDKPTSPICGDNCSPVPIEPLTWSRIKAAYR